MFKLKTDPKLPHHYLLSVSIHDMVSKNRGKMFIKHGPLYFSNKDVENVMYAMILSQDRLFETSVQQAFKNFECSGLAGSIKGMQLAAKANNCTMHHFSSPCEIEDEWFVTLVDLANTSEHNMQLLEKSRMG